MNLGLCVFTDAVITKHYLSQISAHDLSARDEISPVESSQRYVSR